jgi:putative ABC transport system ATP-binding protein
MNMLGCLDTPTTGSYKLDGKEVSKLKDDDLAVIRNFKIGFIFQKFNLLQKLSALENVELPLIYQGLKEREARKRAMESLQSVGLLTSSPSSTSTAGARSSSSAPTRIIRRCF